MPKTMEPNPSPQPTAESGQPTCIHGISRYVACERCLSYGAVPLPAPPAESERVSPQMEANKAFVLERQPGWYAAPTESGWAMFDDARPFRLPFTHRLLEEHVWAAVAAFLEAS